MSLISKSRFPLRSFSTFGLGQQEKFVTLLLFNKNTLKNKFISLFGKGTTKYLQTISKAKRIFHSFSLIWEGETTKCSNTQRKIKFFRSYQRLYKISNAKNCICFSITLSWITKVLQNTVSGLNITCICWKNCLNPETSRNRNISISKFLS